MWMMGGGGGRCVGVSVERRVREVCRCECGRRGREVCGCECGRRVREVCRCECGEDGEGGV